MSRLQQHELIELREGLSHMHISELKKELMRLNLSPKAHNKQELIDRLVHYASTGKELKVREFPPCSKAIKSVHYPLHASTLMMYGNYKNDLATRLFFKKLIGDHFHFTAQGIDWLRERWLAGTPPTYGDFATMWQKEYQETLDKKRPAKQEWAYIRCTQEYKEKNPNCSKEELMNAWQQKRSAHITRARELLKMAIPL